MKGLWRWWDALGLAARFRLLMLLTYVPSMVVGGGLMTWLYVAAEHSYFRQVEHQAQLAYTSLDRWLLQQVAFLRLLSSYPSMQRGPNEEAHRLLSWIDRGTPGWIGLSMLDASGRVVLSTTTPYGQPPLDLSDRDFVRQALRSGKPAMSGYVSIAPLERPAVTLLYPYRPDGTQYVLAVHYAPEALGKFLTGTPFLGESVVSLADGSGHRLARSDTTRRIGERLTSEAYRFAKTHDRGVKIVRWGDRVSRITAVYHHPPTGWIVFAGTPVDRTLGMIQRMLLAILAVGMVGFTILFCMLHLGIRQATRPMGMLMEHARLLGRGELGVRVPPLPARELDELGRTFNQMAQELQQSHTTLEAQVAERTQKLSRAIERLRSLDRLKDHFLSTISHEMKTPLSLIIGYTELLQDKYPGEELLKGLQDGSRRLTTHINNMLDYSAMLGGSLPLYTSEVSLEEVTRNALAIVETDLALKHLHVEVSIHHELPSICGDSRRITQMIVELLDNARKATPEGGRIGVEVFPVEEHVRIVVWDTGQGIAQEDLERIWEAFSQLQTEDAMRSGGLGLGLTIVKKLVELHQGRVSVESQPGKGSRFIIELPID